MSNIFFSFRAKLFPSDVVVTKIKPDRVVVAYAKGSFNDFNRLILIKPYFIKQFLYIGAPTLTTAVISSFQ